MERYDPDLWTDEFAFLNQPGQADIQSERFYDYRTNVDAYPKWQACEGLWLTSGLVMGIGAGFSLVFTSLFVLVFN